MNQKGFTLIEVILAIAIIGLIAVSFLPLITFSYSNLIGSEKFTQNMFDDQQLIEREIHSLRYKNPVNPTINFYEMFGVNVPVHNINVNTSSSGQVKVYLPKQTVTPRVPVIKESPVMKARWNTSNSDVNPQPKIVDIFDKDYNFFVTEVPITVETKLDFLMNVYRWYSTDVISESETASNSTNNFIIIKEWNEAKRVLPYSQAISTGFTPNIKEYTVPSTGKKEQYNVLNYDTLQKAFNYNLEEMINIFGNRYVRYGVTPYSIAGRIGVEELSNAIYIKAPRIEILESRFHRDDNSIEITFNVEIADSYTPSSMIFNEVLGQPASINRDDLDHRKLILEFSNTLNKTTSVGGNTLLRGAVTSKTFGAITIWSGGYPNAEFTITP